jgi:GNAT superfamily N-acetyltransferase
VFLARAYFFWRTVVFYLRAADQLDSLSLARLRAASLAELEIVAASDADEFVTRAAFAFSTLFRADRIAAWVACEGERVVASSCVVFFDRLPYPDGSRHAELCGVYVKPLYRKRGLASELVREVVAAAGASGARKMFLRPSQTVKSLYGRLGFVESEVMVFEQRGQRVEPAPTEPVLAAWPRC